MKVVRSFCDCQFCILGVNEVPAECCHRYRPGGWCPECKCWTRPVLPEGCVSYVETGGRRPVLIFLEPGEDYVWLSRKEVGTPVEGEIARFPASIHGCDKIVKRQEIVIVKK